MKRRIVSIVLTLSMVLSMLPVTASAAEVAPEENAENITSSAVAGTPETAVEEVQALIDALPAVEDVRAMDTDGQRAAYAQTQTAYDAYIALSGEQRDLIVGAEKFEALFAFFNGQIAPTAITISGDVTWENETFDQAVSIEAGKTVTITLKGTNTVTSDSYNYAAINVLEGSTLIIRGDGSLNAYGFGHGSSGGNGSAGIGTGRNGNSTAAYTCGDIIIEGGTVYAQGGYGCAGIGMAHYQNDGGSLTVRGGTVTAQGGSHGGGIGRRKDMSGPNFTVTVNYPGHVAYTSQNNADNYVALDERNGDVNWKSYGWIRIAPSPVTSVSPAESGTVTVRASETTDFSGFFSTSPNTACSNAGFEYSVSGNKSSGTTINTNGVLTIGNDETAPSVTVTAVSKADYSKSVRITAAIEYSPKAKTGLVYTGQAQALVEPPSVNGANLEYSLNGGNFSSTAPTAVDAGTYTVRYQTKNANYIGTTGPRSFTVTINKANSTVKPSDSTTVIYGGTLTLTAQVTIATLAANDNNVEFVLSNGKSLGSVAVSSTGGGTATLTVNVTSANGFAIGSNTITAKYNGSVNLNGSDSNTITVTVHQKELTVNGAKAADRTYEPNNTAVTVSGGTLEGVVGSENVTLNNTGVGTMTNPDAGHKAVTVTGYTLTGSDAGHYTLKQPEGVTVNITKATPEVTPPTAISDLKYSGSDQPLVEAGTTTGGEMQYRLNENSSYSAAIPTGNAAGSYTVYYKVAGGSNYEDVEVADPINVTIAETDQPAPVVTIDYKAEVLSTTADMEYSLDGNAPWTPCDAVMPVATGAFGWDGTEEVTVYFRYAADANHSASAAQALEIPARPVAPKEVILTKSKKSITVTGADGEFELSRDGETWNNGQELTNLAAGQNYTVYVRTPAVEASALSRAAGVFASFSQERNVTTVKDDGSTTLKPGETVETENGGTITNNGDNITLDDGSGSTTTVTPPEGEDFSDGAEVDGDGNVTVPDSTTVNPPGGPDITVGEKGGAVDEDGNVTLPGGGSAKIGDNTVTAPDSGGTLKPDGEGGVEVPGGSTVTPPGGPDITVDEQGGTVDEDGNVTLPGGGSAQVGDTTVTVPEDGGTLEPDGEGSVEVPGGSTVMPDGGPEIELGEDGGTLKEDGSIELPGGASAKIGDNTVTAPDSGGTLKPDGNGNVEFPGGSIVTDSEGKESTVPSQGGKIDSEGKYAANSSGGSTGGGSTNGGYVSTYTITVSQTEHGKVTVSPTSTASGKTVTVTVTADEGYELSKLTATDSRGNELTLTDKGNGTYTFTMPSRSVTVTAAFTLIPPEVCDGGPDCPGYSFADLDAHAWYHEAVDYVINRSLMGGYGNGIFGPGDTLTRAMLAEILFRLEGSVPVNYLMQYNDVPADTWYTEATRWATSEGIVSGYGNGVFGPNDPITREQLAVMLYRYEQYKFGVTEAWIPQLTFADTAEISDWAYDAIGWCTANGIIEGKGNGILDPKDKATRAEVAAMIMRFLLHLMGK